MRNEKLSYFIRIIAGAYLFYLAVQLVQGIAKGNMTGGSMILGICASILFFGAGAYFVLASIRGLLRMMRGDNEQKIEDEAVRKSSKRKNPRKMQRRKRRLRLNPGPWKRQRRQVKKQQLRKKRCLQNQMPVRQKRMLREKQTWTKA